MSVLSSATACFRETNPAASMSLLLLRKLVLFCWQLVVLVLLGLLLQLAALELVEGFGLDARVLVSGAWLRQLRDLYIVIVMIRSKRLQVLLAAIGYHLAMHTL